MMKWELNERHRDEQPVSLGMSEVLVIGMGRLGAVAYDSLRERDERIVGLDTDPGKVQQNIGEGRPVVVPTGGWTACKSECDGKRRLPGPAPR
ncbi:NAD-binding protein [Pseudomonadota bacterium]